MIMVCMVGSTQGLCIYATQFMNAKLKLKLNLSLGSNLNLNIKGNILYKFEILKCGTLNGYTF